MVALKGASIGQFVQDPPQDAFLTVIYGPDTGMVAERGRAIAAILAGRIGGEVADFDCTSTERSRIFETAQASSLFGGQPVLLLRSATNGDTALIDALREDCPETPLVVQAGDLKPGTSLRKRAEAAGAYALPCYLDDEKALTALIRETVSQSGLAIAPDAVSILRDMVGTDRMGTRSELEKLCLYAQETGTITSDDVIAICGDGGAYTLSDLADAVGLGKREAADSHLARTRREGLAPQALLAALRGHFLQLRTARTAIEAGATAEAAIQKLRPRIFFKREGAFRAQLMRWSVSAVDTALDLIAQTDLQTRKDSDMADTLVARLCLKLPALAAR